jgi:hypothetical protein
MNIYVINFVGDLQQVRDFALRQFSGFVQVILMFNATGLITKESSSFIITPCMMQKKPRMVFSHTISDWIRLPQPLVLFFSHTISDWIRL